MVKDQQLAGTAFASASALRIMYQFPTLSDYVLPSDVSDPPARCLQMLGKGSFGSAWLVTELATKAKWVIKACPSGHFRRLTI